MNGPQYAEQAHNWLDISERTAVTYEAEQAACLGRAQINALLAIFKVLERIDDALRNTVGGRP